LGIGRRLGARLQGLEGEERCGSEYFAESMHGIGFVSIPRQLGWGIPLFEHQKKILSWNGAF
jgi:hypothetical protein